mgnify:CR=1 FL=1
MFTAAPTNIVRSSHAAVPKVRTRGQPGSSRLLFHGVDRELTCGVLLLDAGVPGSCCHKLWTFHSQLFGPAMAHNRCAAEAGVCEVVPSLVWPALRQPGRPG